MPIVQRSELHNWRMIVSWFVALPISGKHLAIHSIFLLGWQSWHQSRLDLPRNHAWRFENHSASVVGSCGPTRWLLGSGSPMSRSAMKASKPSLGESIFIADLRALRKAVATVGLRSANFCIQVISVNSTGAPCAMRSQMNSTLRRIAVESMTADSRVTVSQ